MKYKQFKTLLIAAFLTAAIASGAEPAVGTWKLNVAKSKLTDVPKSQVATMTQAGSERTIETHTVAADGKETHNKTATTFDGKEHPYTGTTGGYDSYVARGSANGYSSVVTYKKGGKVVRTYRAVYSQDGKTRTGTAKGVDGSGKAYTNVYVYDRQ